MSQPPFKLQLHDGTEEVDLYHIMRPRGADWKRIDGECTESTAIGHVIHLIKYRIADLFALEDSTVYDSPHIRMAQEIVSKEIERWEEWQKNPHDPTSNELGGE